MLPFIQLAVPVAVREINNKPDAEPKREPKPVVVAHARQQIQAGAKTDQGDE